MGKGYLIIYLGDDHARFFHSRKNVIADQAATVVAVFIRRADLDERDVTRDDTGFNIGTDLADMAGYYSEFIRLGHGA